MDSQALLVHLANLVCRALLVSPASQEYKDRKEKLAQPAWQEAQVLMEAAVSLDSMGRMVSLVVMVCRVFLAPRVHQVQQGNVTAETLSVEMGRDHAVHAVAKAHKVLLGHKDQLVFRDFVDSLESPDLVDPLDRKEKQDQEENAVLTGSLARREYEESQVYLANQDNWDLRVCLGYLEY